ncbi:hypothetical protein F511_19823 [Dorcoceras hygrometricum]|uniref:Uncharacterized protein n=1 Tax=Dorcoceras hygrometricum TaxID=472368 RepID=A0A2Z7C0F3_9LAMI|nr:hypothetical protein F511_19823 [Dorcoceras hygrometricum]
MQANNDIIRSRYQILTLTDLGDKTSHDSLLLTLIQIPHQILALTPPVNPETMTNTWHLCANSHISNRSLLSTVDPR